MKESKEIEDVWDKVDKLEKEITAIKQDSLTEVKLRSEDTGT